MKVSLKRIIPDKKVGITEEEIDTINTDINLGKREYYNKFSLEKINFTFDEYYRYPDDTFLPSVYFFKFLAAKPDLESKKVDRLKLFIPDTVVFNDGNGGNYWIYTDLDGHVIRTEKFNDSHILEKLRSATNDENELIAVSKMPVHKHNQLRENYLELLNFEELEKHLLRKNSNSYALQRFIKCRGPKAFLCRTVWRRDKPSYVYILTNIANYHDNNKNQSDRFIITSNSPNTYCAFYATSGKHLDETIIYMKNIVKFIEKHSDILLDELVGDFVK